MQFILFYSIFVGTTLTGVGVNMVANQVAEEIRSGQRPPIVVPKEAGIPWLTEKTRKQYQEWDQEHRP